MERFWRENRDRLPIPDVLEDRIGATDRGDGGGMRVRDRLLAHLVDAGGRRLHLNVMGEDKDGPTVILEAGGMSSQWAWIQPEIAEFARVVSYDRAGLGWSEQPHDARHISQQLHTALEEAGIGGPYVLVGHSMGGVYARQFAGDYPDEVAGMVLLDSSYPDLLTGACLLRL